MSHVLAPCTVASASSARLASSAWSRWSGFRSLMGLALVGLLLLAGAAPAAATTRMTWADLPQSTTGSFARALAPQPRLLLADEPTAALDRDSGRMAVELFRRLADDQGAAIVMVTHDNKILDIADRVVTLEDGRLVDAGPAAGTAGSV